jgi:hypothetical protein
MLLTITNNQQTTTSSKQPKHWIPNPSSIKFEQNVQVYVKFLQKMIKIWVGIHRNRRLNQRKGRIHI